MFFAIFGFFLKIYPNMGQNWVATAVTDGMSPSVTLDNVVV